MSDSLIKVLCAGTFDRFHEGHRSFLDQASVLGDELHVIVARDVSVKRIKHKMPVQSETLRLAQVSEYAAVTQAYLGDENDFFYIPERVQPHIICVGYDQHLPESFALRFPYTKIYFLKAHLPEIFKSSILGLQDCGKTQTETGD